MMKYKLNIQMFANSTKTITGDGNKVSTTTYTPGGWYYSTDGMSWANYLCSATTSVSITNNAHLRNLADYGAKIGSWGSSSSMSTTYNPITLPEYPTKDSTVKSSSTSTRQAYLSVDSGVIVSITDGWNASEKSIYTNNNSISTTTTYINYSANGYYTKQSASAEPVSLYIYPFTMEDGDGSVSETAYLGMLEILATAIDKTNRTIDLSLRFTIAPNNNTTVRFYDWTPPTNTNWITVGNEDTGDSYTIETTDLYTLLPGSTDPLVLGTFELGTYSYESTNSMTINILGEWGGYNSSIADQNQVFAPMATSIDTTQTITNLDQITISTEDTYTLVGTAGSSYTPTSSSTQLYTLYDESESTTTTGYSAITLPNATREGYTLVSYHNSSSLSDFSYIGVPGDSYVPQYEVDHLYIKWVANKKIYVKDNNTIKEITSCYQKINGSWVSKTVEEMYTILDDLTYYKDGG